MRTNPLALAVPQFFYRARSSFLLFIFLLSFSWSEAQIKTNILPTADKAHLLIFLKDLDKRPIAKAPIRLQSEDGASSFELKSGKTGIVEALVPHGQYYHITIGDSTDYDRVFVAKKSMLVVRHTTYFQGRIGKKVYGGGRPEFSMMRPTDGLAQVHIRLLNNDKEALPNEKIRVQGQLDPKIYTATTDKNGVALLKVPMGDLYQIRLEYNDAASRFEIPYRTGSGKIAMTLVYPGSESIRENLKIFAEVEAEFARIDSLKTLYPDSIISSPILAAYGYGQTFVDPVKAFRELADSTGGKFYKVNGQQLVDQINSIFREEVTNKTDICLLIDNSGSMHDDIDMVKSATNRLISALKNKTGVRVAVATYSDFWVDGRAWFALQDFGKNPNALTEQVEKIGVAGGGDYPESVYDGIWKAVDQLSWRPGARKMVLVIGDAPPLRGKRSKHSKGAVFRSCRKAGVQANLYPVLIQ